MLVQLVNTPDAGVPNAGVVSVGLVSVLFVSVCVSVVPTTVPAGLPVPPAGKVTPELPSIVVAMCYLARAYLKGFSANAA